MAQIPQPFQGICRRYYYGWQFLICGGCFFDIIASIIYFAAVSSHGDDLQVKGPAVQFVGLRVAHFLLLFVGYFWFIYWPLYKALKKNSPIAWLFFWINNTTYFIWLAIMVSGIWPGELQWSLISDSRWTSTIFGIASIVDKGIWSLLLFWWIFSTMRVYMIYMYEAAPVHAKLTSNTELETRPKEKPTPPAKKSIWDNPTATTKVAGQDVNVSIDPKIAASVAKTAYTSGAAGELAAGTKAKVGPDGKLIYEIDPKAAQKAAMTMHSSGATSELASGTTVSSGGWNWGKGAAPVPLAPSGKILKVLHDFIGQEQGDLTIKIGDRITFIRAVDDNWIEGTLNGKKGIFPAKFVTDV